MKMKYSLIKNRQGEWRYSAIKDDNAGPPGEEVYGEEVETLVMDEEDAQQIIKFVRNVKFE